MNKSDRISALSRMKCFLCFRSSQSRCSYPPYVTSCLNSYQPLYSGLYSALTQPLSPVYLYSGLTKSAIVFGSPSKLCVPSVSAWP